MRQTRLFNDTEAYMIALIRYGILDKKPDNIPPSAVVDWDKMMDFAAAQGVLGWVWDGICKLPKDDQPPRQQAINWGLSAQGIWDRYNKQKRVLMQMIDICNQNNIRLLLFKGIALSELFPRPESRPSGDIDIYLFEDYKRGDQIFAKENVTRTNKRTGFDYQGVHIENHRIFLNAYKKKQVNAIKYLESSLKDIRLTKDGYYIMSPIANIVYQVMHFLAHLDDISNPLSLRFVVDFGVSMTHYKDYIHPEELKVVLKSLKITEAFCLLLRLAEIIMGIDLGCYYFKRIEREDCESVINLIKSRPMQSVSLYRKSFIERVKMYSSHYIKFNRLFKYMFQNRIEYVLKSIRELFSVSVRRFIN